VEGQLGGTRALRTGLRTLHLLAFGALYGGHVFGVAVARLEPALVAVIATGSALMLLDAAVSPISLIQVRGLATFSKIALVIAASVRAEFALALLTLAAVIGAVSSHMPGSWRYHSVWHGRVIGSREKG
jgi:hypothetical protein